MPLAWLLVTAFSAGALGPGAALVCVLVLAARALRKLDLARQGLVRSNTALAARISELATLHSIGREILSSLDPGRVFDLTLPLERAAEAYAAMDERRSIKALLRP